jgi:hypothetical protein
LQGANFLELHETFLDMCAHNLSSLALPLARKDALLRISLGRFCSKENFLSCTFSNGLQLSEVVRPGKRKSERNTIGLFAGQRLFFWGEHFSQLSPQQLQVECAKGTDRGKAILQVCSLLFVFGFVSQKDGNSAL